MGKWKYFTDMEGIGMSEDVMRRADMARELCGFAFVGTSFFRTPEKNAELPTASPNSSHMKGLAIDFAAPVDPELKAMMAAALGIVGFRQVEICPRHIHAGLDPDKPIQVWLGKDS